MHNEQLMGIRREEEMEMSDDDMEDLPDSKDSEDSGMHMCMTTTEKTSFFKINDNCCLILRGVMT